MEEHRNIVCILGNGFDIDLGLKTSYKDFWESNFCPRDYPAPLIVHLNGHWPNSLKEVKWYDLENELYYYAKSFNANNSRKDIITQEELKLLEVIKPEFISFGVYDANYKEQLNSLIRKRIIIKDSTSVPGYKIPYLDDLSKSPIERDKIALELIKDGLCKYIKHAEQQARKELSIASHVLLSLLKTSDHNGLVEIFTFNYTSVQYLGHRINEIPVYHMHGQCDEGSIIIGTRDDTEIDANYVFVQKAMDSSFCPPQLVGSLHAADEVIIFGHSIGENDRQYFKAFFKQQTEFSHPKGKDITIFTKDSVSEVQIKLALQNMTDGNLSTLCSQNKVHFIKTEEFQKGTELFFDFLIKHHTDSYYADVIIGKIQSQQANKEVETLQ